MSARITGQTLLTGIIGYPLRYTLSPVMHNAAFSGLNLDWCYVPLVVSEPDLPAAIQGIRALGFIGVNVTMPHKEAVLPLVDELSAEARQVSAVNTIHKKDNRLVGHNTDLYGFSRALAEAGYEPRGQCAVLIGAGGAARTAAFSLAASGVSSLIIINRTKNRAQFLASAIRKKFSEIFVKELSFADALADTLKQGCLIINTTPIGMGSEDGAEVPIDVDVLGTRHFVFDLIYDPIKTNLLKEAELRGSRTLGGLDMLIYQAAASFEIWTGRPAPVDAMRRAVLKKLNDQSDK